MLMAQIKDTSNFKKVDIKSQYLKWTPGYVYAGMGDEQIGYALASQFDYEYFFRAKLSVVTRIGFNYSYFKHINEVYDFNTGLGLKKYLRIGKSYFPYVSSVLMNNVQYYYKLNSNRELLKSIGQTLSFGIGVQLIGNNKDKTNPSKFGADFGFSLLNFYTKVPTPFVTIALAYRIN